MDKLMVELMEAVDKGLPHMVGEQLKKRLIQADKDAEEAARIPTLQKMYDEAHKKLAGMDTREKDATRRESEVSLRETNTTLREKLVELKEQHAKDRVTEMRGVVQDVFANAKFKYQDVGSSYTSTGGSSSVSRTIETTEGK